MASKKEETASFMVRFTQKIYNNEAGEPQVQWRGNIRHVQGGDEKRFSNFDEVVLFIQNKLTNLTMQATEDKTPEEQEGILSKSLSLWKRFAAETPKMVLQTIKDPKKQVAQFQDQLQDQFHHVRDELEQKLDLDTWLRSSKSDTNQILEQLQDLSEQVAHLHQRIDVLTNQKTKK